MKQFLITSVLLLFVLFQVNGQNETSNISNLRPLSLENIEFTLYPNPSDSEFKLEFLMPRAQEMEIYLIDLTGDKVKDLLERQTVETGVKTYDFTFPKSSPFGIYFLVIKSSQKSIIKKIEHKAKV